MLLVLDNIRIWKEGFYCMKLIGRGRNIFKGIYYDVFKDIFYYLEILI